MTTQVLPASTGHHPPSFAARPTRDPLPPSSTANNGAHPSSNGAMDHHHSQQLDSKMQSDSPSAADEASRGRRRTRDAEYDDDDDAQNGEDGQAGAGSSKKRRRSRKGLDKKFECPHEGCGKSYSRAEHLYRHQLNHNPKQIYNCDFPECGRSFVRQDLCARHKERHTAKGSQLLRKENFIQNLNPIVTAAMQAQSQRLQKAQQSPSNFSGAQQHPHNQSPASHGPSSVTARSDHSSTPLDPSLQSPRPDSHVLQRPMTGEATDPSHNRAGAFSSPAPFGPHGPVRQYSAPQPGQNYDHHQQYSRHSSHSQVHPSPGFESHSSFPPMSQLPPPGYSTMHQAQSGAERAGNFPTSASDSVAQSLNAVTEGGFIEGMTPTYAMPMFGGDGYNRSPLAMADDFTAWLFNDQNFAASTNSMGYLPGSAMYNANYSLQAPYFNYDPMVNGQSSNPVPPQHSMAVSSLIDSNLQQVALSEERRQAILDLIDTQFTDTSHAPVKKKEELLEGNKDDDRHILSLQMMQTYIGSYWLHFHPQMPILHKPTFSANTCPELLLVVVMALGASCLEKTHGYDVTQNCAELAGFLAWHLRWAIFMNADFRPPAKLWIFQALLLLEIFEKMYSSRPLHERAHIHHATTLTLMRRGSSLIGRSSIDSPPSGSTSTTRTGSINGALNNAGGSSNTYTPDEWWNQWITNEATRRAAFAAFVMDSVHATMFGHSAVMVAHEMRLPLPCDEALWNATSSAEVGRAEQSLLQSGIKPVTFLEGLKRTLNNLPVRTNSFGRTILMAGLLSVSWHMNQRDLQVSSLGGTQVLGGRDKWRGSLTRAFDHWKADLDKGLENDLQHTQHISPHSGFHYNARLDEENVFESRTVLHHLAHMAMHVDIVDCQIFAGASRLLGRGITPQDYNGAQRRMKEGWAPTARARDATFYALRFLSQVLLDNHTHKIGAAGLAASSQKGSPYSARDDYLLNRPWVLYFATLIVWSYGYALDGPIRPLYRLDNTQEIVDDMRGYLQRVGGVRAPDDLAKIGNRNACLGLLILMRDTFKLTRWELLHEASRLLTKCIEMLSSGAAAGGNSSSA